MANRFKVTISGKEIEVTLHSRKDSNLTFSVNGKTYQADVQPVLGSDQVTRPQVQVKHALPEAGDLAPTSETLAPMPGIIVEVSVSVGDEVAQGDTVVVMEAMKMENNIPASKAGRVTLIHVEKGQEVETGQLLISIE
ncbi:MAG: biotin/lipoyl-binding protein [Bdellovibrionales bacterium]|nr:biotin/lipoyl-binding protein [Bdellovibrionales bacterium]